MANQNAIVGTVDWIDPAAGMQPESVGADSAQRPTVIFQPLDTISASETASLDPQHGLYRDTLDALKQFGKPAYVEVSATGVISKVLIPIIGRVLDITRERTGNFHVLLDASSARHVVKASLPGFRQALELLKNSRDSGAVLALTAEPDEQVIFDVRPAPNLQLVTPRLHRLAPQTDVINKISTVTRVEAEQFFREMALLSCKLPDPDPACIPFLFPDNGCWGRAHRMCQLMADKSITAGKVWIYGTLRVRTANHHRCRVHWNWHVAPVVRVSGGRRLHLRVIDPSLFHHGTVSRRRWKRAQGDKHAQMVVTARWVFMQPRPFDGREENKSVYKGLPETEEALMTFRRELADRANGKPEPPPYGHCSLSRRGSRGSGLVEPPQDLRISSAAR